MTVWRFVAAGVGVAVGAGATPQLGSAEHWWRNGIGEIIHPVHAERPAISFSNRGGFMWWAIEDARRDWNDETTLDLYDVGRNTAATVTAWEGQWCAGWSGLATADGYKNGHYGTMTVQVDTCSNSYAKGANYYGSRAVACQEIGHSVGGLGHEGPGCMGFSYGGQVPGGSNDVNDSANWWNSKHDIDMTNRLWVDQH